MQGGEAGRELQGATVQADVVCIQARGHSAQVTVGADGQGAGVDLCATCIAVGCAQGQGARAFLFDDARARNDVSDGHRIGLLEAQHAVVDDVACSQSPHSGAVAHHQSAGGVKAGATGVGVGGGEGQHASAQLGKARACA